MNPPLRYCPRDFNGDMTDPRNLAYCQEIQRERGHECRVKGCPYCAEAEVVEDKAPVQDRPAPVQRGLF